MALSDEELAKLREKFDRHMYHFLLPLLRCDDITWDEQSRQILLAGEHFARCRWNADCRVEILTAKKFQRNGSVIMIDGVFYTMKKDNTQEVRIWYTGSDRLFLNMNRKRCVSGLSEFNKCHMLYNYCNVANVV